MDVNEAEQKIAAILRQLEVDTDCIVESIGCSMIDVTTFKDDRTQLKMKVDIELQRQPGRSW